MAGARARRGDGDPLEVSFDELRDAGKQVVMVFAFGEPLRDELERAGHLEHMDRWPNMTVELLDGTSHTLTPVNLQRQAHALVDEALERDFALGRERVAG